MRWPTIPDRAAWNDALADAIAAFEPDLVVLAGFMRVLAPDGGAAGSGSSTPTRRCCRRSPARTRFAMRSRPGSTQTGVTVHWVDEGVDTGPIIAQRAVPVEPGDDEDTLRGRIQAVEKPLYVQAIRQLCAGAHREPGSPSAAP